MTKSFGRFAVAILGAALAGRVVVPSARAQVGSAQSPVGSGTDLRDLAKEHKNPLAQSINVPFQFTTGFGVGSEHRTGESLNIQPVLPFPLTSAWSAVALPSLSVTYAPSPDAEFGLQDLQLSLFLTPARTDERIWGVGPIVQLPTASDARLGTGKWSAGPTAAAVYSKGPWFDGVLASHLWSFVGQVSRDAVNLTSLEVMVSYNFRGGWYVQFNPVNSYDWTADSRDAWTVPVGLDVGKVFDLGPRSISAQVGGYEYVRRPTGAPDRTVRAQVQLSFPAGK
jgi:hypothetical protein